MEEFENTAMQSDAEESCFKQNDSGLPKVLSLGMAYVPMQRFEKLYQPDVGLSRGTIFQALDFPFLGEVAVK